MRSVTILDGGMGRELHRIGAPFRQPEWSALALMEGPDWVVTAHRNFIRAGADVITTNAYAVVPFHIGDDAFRRSGRDLARLAGECARRAADEALAVRSADPVRVAGSLPPLFGSYEPDSFDAVRAPVIIDPLIEEQVGFIDLWLAETLSSIAEAVAVREGLTRAGSTSPLWISYTLAESPDATLRSGERVHEAVRAALDLGAEAVLFNCCQVETIEPAFMAARAALPGSDVRVGAYANRFVAHHIDNAAANNQISAYRDDVDEATYAEFASSWHEAGASIIGGCCGITPDHIRSLAAALA